MDALGPSDVLLFNHFRLDRRGLSRRDERGTFVPVKIGARTLEVLQVLIKRPGDLMAKDEIIAAVWPGVVVEYSNLTMQVSLLRRILDQGSTEECCIQTVAGRGYRFIASVTSANATGATALAPAGANAAPRISLVVLPFANLSADPEQEYFADAITDDLTTDLSRIPDSFVTARTTAFAYKGKAVEVRQVARELGVRYVLEGSVRRMGERIQVNVQLIDGETGSHVWADRLDIDGRDLAATQSEITGRLGRTLEAELVRDIGHRIEQERAANLDARDLVLRARSLTIQTLSFAVHPEARDLLEQALVLDPASVDARIELARLVVSDIADGLSSSVERDQTRAEQLIREALEGDRNRSQAHSVMGQLRRVQGRWAESQLVLKTAIALDQNNGAAVRQLGTTVLAQGKPEAAIPYLEKAIRLDWRGRHIFNGYLNLGRCHLFLGRTNEAVDLFRKARALTDIWYVDLDLAGALGLRGDIDEAKREILEALKFKPEVNSIARWRAIAVTQGFGHPQFQAVRDKTTYAGLRRAGFPEE